MMDWTDRLRLRHLRVLLSLAQTSNLSQSATALNTTQPALSKWLKELEADVGLPLFERHARGLKATAYGEALIEHARRIEAHLDIARDDMDALRESGRGLVVIGTSGVASADTVPLAVARLLEKLPGAQVKLLESTMDLLLPQLARGEVDIVVGRSTPDISDPQIEAQILYREPIHFLCRPGHPLAEKASLDWPDLLAYPWIIWPPGTPVRTAFEIALAAAGQALPRHFVESNSAILNISLLGHSDHLGVASHRGALRFARLNAVTILPIPLMGLGPVSLYWRRDSANREAVAAALTHLRATAKADPPT